MSRRRFIRIRARKIHRPTINHDERGQSLLEAAFVVPILLLLVVIIVDAARAFDAYIVLTNAVREGARYGSLAVTPPREAVDVQTLVIQDVLGGGTNITHMGRFTSTNVIVTETADDMAVTAWYNFPLWFGGIVGLDTFRLEKTAVMPKYLVSEPEP